MRGHLVIPTQKYMCRVFGKSMALCVRILMSNHCFESVTLLKANQSESQYYDGNVILLKRKVLYSLSLCTAFERVFSAASSNHRKMCPGELFIE